VIVAIGCSWGGLKALEHILDALPQGLPAPIVIAQHRAPDDGDLLAGLLSSHTDLGVQDAEDKHEMKPGCVYLGPPGYHLLVEKGTLALSTQEEVHFSRPSIDVLFTSAADSYGSGCVGVLLTGANADGAQGLAHIKRRGGHTIVQDPDDAERSEMPAAAIAELEPDVIVALDGVASAIVRALR